MDSQSSSNGVNCILAVIWRGLIMGKLNNDKEVWKCSTQNMGKLVTRYLVWDMG